MYSSNFKSERTNYLAVATYSDILFKPLDDYGILALAIIKALIHQHRIEFDQIHGLPKEDDEDLDRIYLEGLNPVEWKDQDHYAVLGLRHLRIRATDEDIKRAYRNRCLKHHPDKRQGAGQIINPEGDYFACIVKAQEILGIPQKRRSYDSVDPEFSNFTPSKKIQSDFEFYKVYGTWFALNARWSNIEPVPLLGNEYASRANVEHFYSFWFNFDSWREYSYLDEEEKEKGQYREERRWIDKQNKLARAKLKKEELARIRSVIDAAYSYDPRVSKFKQEEKQRKLEIKEAKVNLAKQKQMEIDKIQKEAEDKIRLEREKEENATKEQELAIKKEKESQKKVLKKERKTLRTICKDCNYFSQGGPEEQLENMTNMEHLCEILTSQEMQELNTKLSSLSVEEGKVVFLESVSKVTTKILQEKEESARQVHLRNGGGDGTKAGSLDDWNTDELSLLIKAVNLFPAGTNQRWEVIANFLQQHSPEGSSCKKRTARQILLKAKDLNSSDFSKNSMKKVANEQAFAIFEKTHKPVPVEAEASTRLDEKETPSSTTHENGGVASRPWTTEEQKLLEQALKTYSSKESDRWDHVAACVPGRTKRECMLRFKELAALIKAKKAAMGMAGKS